MKAKRILNTVISVIVLSIVILMSGVVYAQMIKLPIANPINSPCGGSPGGVQPG